MTIICDQLGADINAPKIKKYVFTKAPLKHQSMISKTN